MREGCECKTQLVLLAELCSILKPNLNAICNWFTVCLLSPATFWKVPALRLWLDMVFPLSQDKDQQKTCSWTAGRHGCKQSHEGHALIPPNPDSRHLALGTSTFLWPQRKRGTSRVMPMVFQWASGIISLGQFAEMLVVSWDSYEALLLGGMFSKAKVLKLGVPRKQLSQVRKK